MYGDIIEMHIYLKKIADLLCYAAMALDRTMTTVVIVP